MTYTFTKLIADNLMFGSYNDVKSIHYGARHYVTIKDINSHTQVTISISTITHSFITPSKRYWFSKPKSQEITPVIKVLISSGTPTDNCIAREEFFINSEHQDYQFWKDFELFIKAAYNEKVRKHIAVLEDAFYL